MLADLAERRNSSFLGFSFYNEKRLTFIVYSKKTEVTYVFKYVKLVGRV